MKIKKLYYKFFLLFMLISILPLGSYVLVRYFQLEGITSGNVEKNLRNILKNISTKVNNFYLLHKKTVQVLSYSSTVKQFLNENKKLKTNVDSMFNHLKSANSKTYSIVYLLNKNGKCLSTTNIKLLGKNYSFRNYFRNAMKGKIFVSDLSIGVTTKVAGIYISSPVYQGGNIIGVVVIKLKASAMQNIITAQKLKQGYYFMVNKKSIVLAHQVKKYIYSYTKKLTDEENKALQKTKQFPKGFLKFIQINGFSTNEYFKINKQYEIDFEGKKYIAFFHNLNFKDYLLATMFERKAFFSSLNYAINQAIILIAVLIIIIFALISFSASYFTRPIKKVTNMMEKLANNNIDIEVQNTKREDEIGRLFNSIKLLHQNLAEIISFMSVICTYINSTSKNIDTSSEHTTNVVNKIVSGVESQYAMLSAQNSSLNKVTDDISKVAETVVNAYSNAENQKNKISQSADAIKQVAENIKQSFAIMENSSSISKSLQIVAQEGYDTIKNALTGINEVSNLTKKISDVVDVIQNITEQTNLLAMNAAIEAAHAGGAGKGFAVVASEIRKLAYNASKSANEITLIVKNITSKVDETNVLAQKAGTGIDKILADVNKNNEINQKVLSAIVQQSSDIKNVFSFIEEIVAISDEFIDTFQQIQTNIQHIDENSDSLSQASGDINKAIYNNINIVQNLNDSATQVSGVSEKLKDISTQFEAAVSRFYIGENKVALFEENHTEKSKDNSKHKEPVQSNTVED